MSKITWDVDGARLFETGTDRGVLYPKNATTGLYTDGVAWNGLTAVTEAPSGAEATNLWADNIKYATMRSPEEFGGTIEAYMYPDEFAVIDGSATLVAGVLAGQQTRGTFGLCYRTKVGSDANPEEGYKLHLIYGATASPSEKAYATVNDSPEAITFSWEFSTVPVAITGTEYKPVSIITIDSTTADATKLAALEAILYGTDGEPGVAPRLPLPAEVITLMTAA